MSKKEELVRIINRHSLPFCDEVYKLAEEIESWHNNQMSTVKSNPPESSEVQANAMRMSEMEFGFWYISHVID